MSDQSPTRTDPAADTQRTATLAPASSAGAGVVSPVPAVVEFELLDEVGRGGMGVVYRAIDRRLNREVAVKLLQQQFTPDSPAARRFLRESQITAQLQHPGIPAVYQTGVWADGRPFFAMKLIRGKTLDQLLAEKEGLDALAVFDAICRAVGYAHTAGYMHRDLKPQNVMVGAFGEVQVMDWGLARRADEPAPDGEADAEKTRVWSAGPVGAPATEFGDVVGTPAYMSPEQAGGGKCPITTRADVFGLGGILCVLLTGSPPFPRKTAEALQAAAAGDLGETFSRLDASAADPQLIALCKRCLAPDPADRPATANEVVAIVGDFRRRGPVLPTVAGMSPSPPRTPEPGSGETPIAGPITPAESPKPPPRWLGKLIRRPIFWVGGLLGIITAITAAVMLDVFLGRGGKTSHETETITQDELEALAAKNAAKLRQMRALIEGEDDQDRVILDGWVKDLELGLLLDELERKFKGRGLRFIVHEDDFRDLAVPDLENITKYKFKTEQTLTMMTLRDFLDRLLSEIQGTFIINPEFVEITTAEEKKRRGVRDEPLSEQHAAKNARKVRQLRALIEGVNDEDRVRVDGPVKDLELGIILDELERKFRGRGLRFFVADERFKAIAIPDLENISKYKFKTELNLDRLTLHDFLKFLLKEIRGKYVIHPEYVEIMPDDEKWREYEERLRQLEEPAGPPPKEGTPAGPPSKDPMK
jgi:serine/threonine protein kinase